jgi:hypothetical protein
MSHESVKLDCEVAARKAEFDAGVVRFRAALLRGVLIQAEKRRQYAHDLLNSWLDAETEAHMFTLIEAHRRNGGE